MKKAACVKLLALAIVAASLGSRAEARGASHSEHGQSHGHSSALPRAGASYNSGRLIAQNFGRTRSAAWLTYGRIDHASLHGRAGRHYGYSGGGGLQCVTFARSDSGIELTGNARDWWGNAEGVYQRGNRPEPGSVLNFRANGACGWATWPWSTISSTDAR